MAKLTKKRREISSDINFDKVYKLEEALDIIKLSSKAKFVETVEIAINLSLKTGKSDQSIKGVINLPNGIGKKIRVAVIAKDENAKSAKELGADIVGDIDLIKNIENGNIDFDRLIATPDMMPQVGKLGQILGPKGLMPNPKFGTVTNDIKNSVKAIKNGQIEIKNDKDGNIAASIGKKSFSDAKIKENYDAFMKTLLKEKPTGIKGNFVLSAYLTSTMGVSYRLKL